MKKTFSRLQNLLDLSEEYSTVEQSCQWFRIVITQVGTQAYTFNDDNEFDNVNLYCDEMEFADSNIKMFDYVQQDSAVQFRRRDDLIFRRKSSGELYVMN